IVSSSFRNISERTDNLQFPYPRDLHQRKFAGFLFRLSQEPVCSSDSHSVDMTFGAGEDLVEALVERCAFDCAAALIAPLHRGVVVLLPLASCDFEKSKCKIFLWFVGFHGYLAFCILIPRLR